MYRDRRVPSEEIITTTNQRVSSARAEASRKNGARSRGPKTPEGKARASQNALKHGLRAAKHVVLPEEDAAEFAALEAALIAELAPQDTLQAILVGRIARAAWRLERAERIEVDLFAEKLRLASDGGVGLALIRDGYSTRSFETVLRHRGAAQTELLRSLRTLKVLQAEAPGARAEAPAPAPAAASAPVLMFAPRRARAGAKAQSSGKGRSEPCRKPNEPDTARQPNEPKAGRQPHAAKTQVHEPGPRRHANASEPGRTLHEAAAARSPNQPEPRRS